MTHSTDFVSVAATVSTWVNGDCDRRQTECSEAIRELLEDFGEECLLRAVMDTPLAPKLASVNHSDQFLMCRRFLSEIRRAKNRGLCADLLSMALGEGERAGVSLREVGRQWHVTKQAASKQLRKLTDRLNIPTLRRQLSDKARESHRLANRRNHGGSLTP